MHSVGSSSSRRRGSDAEDFIGDDDDDGLDGSDDGSSGSLAVYYQRLLERDVVATTSVTHVLGEKTRAVQGVVGESALIQGLSTLLVRAE